MCTTSLSLLERASRAADAESWHRLAELYSPLLKHWIGRFGVQTADREDLVQEVLIVVARELPDFRHNRRKGAFRRWLRTILVHRLRDFWRSARYRPLATGASNVLDQLDELVDDRSSLSQAWDRDHDEYIMKRLMDTVEPRFEPKTWQAFRQQVIEELPPSEVAAILGMPLSSVYVAKSRVLRALRQEADGLVD